MKKETKIFIVSEAMYFIALILSWAWFWLLVGDIDLTSLRFWGILFIVIFLMFLYDFKKKFEENYL